VIAPIEAPFALLEKPIKILLFDAIEASHVALVETSQKPSPGKKIAQGSASALFRLFLWLLS
jgi:hypothetical protein